MNMDKMALIDTACDELLVYGLWDTKTKIKNWIKKYIFGKQVGEEDLIFWPMGLLAVGLWNCRPFATAALQQKIELSLSAYFTRWEKEKMPTHYLDDLLTGEAFLSIYEEYSRIQNDNGIIGEKNADQYRKAVEKLADYALSYPTDEIGSMPYRANQNNGHIYADSIGLSCPFMYEYGNFFEKKESMELAVKQIANFLAYGIDSATGLPYHGYDVITGLKYGIIGWGRAVGWLLRGMTGCMTTDYGKERLLESYLRLTDSVNKWQRKDGYFSWQLQAVEGPVDTSATGMICLALQEGIRMGILQGEKYEAVLEKGIRAVQRSVKNGRVYDASGECEGFSQYPQQYGAYPWALGPALMLGEEI